MPLATSIYIPWRERAAVTRNEAAIIFNATPDWIRDRLAQGDLLYFQTRRGGPRYICVQSIIDLLDRVEPRHEAAPDCNVQVPVQPLKLIWVNPAM